MGRRRMTCGGVRWTVSPTLRCSLRTARSGRLQLSLPPHCGLGARTRPDLGRLPRGLAAPHGRAPRAGARPAVAARAEGDAGDPGRPRAARAGEGLRPSGRGGDRHAPANTRNEAIGGTSPARKRRSLTRRSRAAGAATSPGRGALPRSWGQSSVHRCPNNEQNLRICRDSKADDGTRTHDLLHGKSPKCGHAVG
jgi:hypothetical protein